MQEESMRAQSGQRPVFRFAPSPNGRMHLGHALSAILNYDMAAEAGGSFLLRIENIDLSRCTPEYEAAVYDDLAWLGLRWDDPVRRQSEHLDTYAAVLEELVDRDLVYPSFMTRGEVKAVVGDYEAAGGIWPRDPEGSPHYPDQDRRRSPAERKELLARGVRHAWRLDMEKAVAFVGRPLAWRETGKGTEHGVEADPSAWGDVVLSRSDAPSSYHLSVVVDDASQGITHVVRGMDLFHATSLHRLLQELLGLHEPVYHHHRLIKGEDGRKLSKSNGSTALSDLRQAGVSPAQIRRCIGL
ncbi:tRNA glutamyl-Q(34) synthetase GluQRS [Rhizobium halophilum]|uniref:tRNA glutamyl-Q(34) synthetase GluQRS n=1 Tax=Rhizobium halophilum TaxID=2846852 RepID=UPI001EFCA95E|nr:tRNA glutamyl-Q(34) synthetase GluQRS [Rhizobium halophilum]MCF6368758.1 tRNA glutamyl-Q(34) synthetase GluQRS [Rhizobium halophilum]